MLKKTAIRFHNRVYLEQLANNLDLNIGKQTAKSIDERIHENEEYSNEDVKTLNENKSDVFCDNDFFALSSLWRKLSICFCNSLPDVCNSSSFALFSFVNIFIAFSNNVLRKNIIC